MAIAERVTRPLRAAGFSSNEVPRWQRLTRSAAPAVAGYLAVRLIGLCVLWIWAGAKGESLLWLLGHKYDSAWYLQIVNQGYDHGESVHSNMAFFPLYPMLARAFAAITPVGPMGAALVLAWLAGIAAAWGLYVLGEHLYDRRTGIILAILWGVLPHAIVESMAYTESLFTALAVWALYAVLTQRWLTAGSLCLLAGLSRPTATALIAAVGLAALVAVIQRPSGWRPWAAGAIAPLGWLGYLGWVAYRTQRLDGWFYIEHEGWNTGWDGGRYTLKYAVEMLIMPSPHLDFYVVTLVMVLAVVLLVVSVRQGQPWQLLLYSAVLLITTIGGYEMYNAKARFLLVAFPLLLPVAIGLARTRTSGAVLTLSTLTLISAYFGGYLLLIWQWSP